MKLSETETCAWGAATPNDEERRHCDVARISAREWSAADFYEAFVAPPGRPVLIRDAIDGWPLADWQPARLAARHGAATFTIACDPFRPHKGGGERSLGDYLEYLAAAGGRDRAALEALAGAGEPYMFPNLLGDEGRFDLLAACPLPPLLAGLGERLGRGYIRVSLQLGVAFSHTGLHFHGEAINGLVVGRKRWFLYSPMWTRLLWEWLRDESLGPRAQLFWLKHLYPVVAGLADDADVRPALQRRVAELRAAGHAIELAPVPVPVPAAAARGRQCFQEAGELLFIPMDWGHWVINYGNIAGLVWEHIHPRRLMPGSRDPQ